MSVHDAVSVHAVAGESNVYEGNSKLERMGNSAPIAFGGCVISQCISAAFASVPSSSNPNDQFQLYSILGNFLGPGNTEVITRYHVEDIRTTRSFATRKVEAWQDLTGSSVYKGKPQDAKRRIMILLFDFQKPEKRSIMEYNIWPMYADEHTKDFGDAVKDHYSSPETLELTKDYVRKQHDDTTATMFARWFPLFDRFYDTKMNTKSLGGQTVFGIASDRKTQQDHLPMTKRTYSTWVRLKPFSAPKKESLPVPPGLQEAALAFFMDGALAFIPLTFSGRFLNQVQACSTLELSLRFFHHPVTLSDWILQEQTTELGHAGKTFSTGRAWNREGKLIASMTQVGIMRPWPEGHEMENVKGKEFEARMKPKL